MRVYQAIHKYSSYIPLFESKYGVTDDTDYESLHRLMVEDGFASTYTLQPTTGESDDVFYTVWDYQRLQSLWAKKHGLKSRDLVEIKLAQIEEYRPDVFYNLSAIYDNGFIRRLGKRKDRKDVYWNGIIEPEPRTIADYDGQLSLHRPYIKYWAQRGLKAMELQPSIPDAWSSVDTTQKRIDVLFYGQYLSGMFDNRNSLIKRLLRYGEESGRDVRCHLVYKERRPTIFRVPKLPWTRVQLPLITFPPSVVRNASQPPLYGDNLYRAIAQARVVVNAYTDNNRDFKSNMRLFEATGLGAFVVSEAGIYPDGFEPGVDFYTYRDSTELIAQLERVLRDWPTHAEIAVATQRKISRLYRKERQWREFSEFIGSL